MKVECSPEAIAPAADPANRAQEADSATGSIAPVSVGFSIALAVLALVAGAGVASLIHGVTPGVAWLTASGLCGSLFVVARCLVRSAPTQAGFVALLALACVTFSYLLVLGGESAPRPTERSALSFFTYVAMLLAVMAMAAALPALVVGVALRSGRIHAAHQPRLEVTPQLLTVGTGALMFVLWILLLATALWASSPQWRVLAIISVAAGSPILLLLFGTYMYERLLSRWRAAAPPSPLLEGLDRLRGLTGVEFDDVLCLEASFGNGRVCQVVSRPGHSTLVVSESIAGELNAPQLLAVLAHEAAHVCLNHLRRKVGWSVVAGIAGLTTAVMAQMVVVPILPRALHLAGVLVVVLPVVMLRGLYETCVTRRHEAEADEFAVHTVSGEALLDALRVLGACGPDQALIHNRWTTHSTWDRRAGRIREWERSRRAGQQAAAADERTDSKPL